MECFYFGQFYSKEFAKGSQLITRKRVYKFNKHKANVITEQAAELQRKHNKIKHKVNQNT